MKKHILSAAIALMAGAFSMNAAVNHLTPVATANDPVENKPMAAATVDLTFNSFVTGVYDAAYLPAEYYIILSDSEATKYDRNTGQLVAKDCWILCLDLFHGPSSPAALPDGVYKKGGYEHNLEYWDENTFAQKYDADGNAVKAVFLNDDVTVTLEGKTYTIRTTVKDTDGTVYNISYTGTLPFDDVAAGSKVYPQIKRDVNADLTGAVSYYLGNEYDSNTGNMYLNLFTNKFEEEGGVMEEDGYCFSLCIFNRRFADPKKAKLLGGTYKVARNFNRGTFFPGMEVDYMGITVQFGTYVKQRVEAEETYYYAYLTDGEIVIEELEDDNYKITVDLVSDLGFSFKGTYTGKVPVYDRSQADTSWESSISELLDDVDLKLDSYTTCTIRDKGVKNDEFQIFFIEIGCKGDYGKVDETNGDYMGIELILPKGTQYVPEGTYQVVDKHPSYDWEIPYYYKPYMAETGYYNTGGYLIGSNYKHWYQPPYDPQVCVGGMASPRVEYWAPAKTGTFGVTRNSDDTYTFNIDVQCDRQFFIKGTWTGKAELKYNPEDVSSIEDTLTDGADAPAIVGNDGVTLTLAGVAADTAVELYSISGIMLQRHVGASTLDISTLTAGTYLLRVGTTTFKFAK